MYVHSLFRRKSKSEESQDERGDGDVRVSRMPTSRFRSARLDDDVSDEDVDRTSNPRLASQRHSSSVSAAKAKVQQRDERFGGSEKRKKNIDIEPSMAHVETDEVTNGTSSQSSFML